LQEEKIQKRICKLPTPQAPKSCNLKTATAPKSDSVSMAYELFTADQLAQLYIRKLGRHFILPRFTDAGSMLG
jgi:hypothetical protein